MLSLRFKMSRYLAMITLIVVSFSTQGCDISTLTSSDDSSSGTGVDPFDPNNLTDSKCDFAFDDSGSGKEFGESCTTDSECRFGVCLPGDAGDGNRANLLSQTFGYCTRGCDCGTVETRLSDEEKATYLCLYPPGNEGRWRHVVLRCESAADCQAFDPRWGRCALPGTGVTKVCME